MRVEHLPGRPGLLPGYVRLQRRVVYGRESGYGTDVLWFEVPEQLAGEAAQTEHPWLLALLPLAFRLGEAVQLPAPADPLLLDNLQTLQGIWSRWFPAHQPIAIQPRGGATLSRASGSRTAALFTGGVDSFFTVLHQDEMARSRTDSEARPVDDLISVWGLDIPLRHREAWLRKQRTLQRIADQLGKRLVPVVTNLRQTRLRRLPYGSFTHGPALGAAGHLLAPTCSRVLISSSFVPPDNEPWGSHPLTDPWMSSSTARCVHYSGGQDRFGKTAFLARSPVALRHLHVCWREEADTNCGHCEKCYRTLIALELLGLGDQAWSFPKARFDPGDLRHVLLRNPAELSLMSELHPHALAHSRPDIAAAIEECVTRSRLNPPRRRTSRWNRFRDEVLAPAIRLRTALLDLIKPHLT